MIDQAVEQAINQQINNELHAWYHYMQMSAYFEDLHLAGFARFFRNQSAEEQAHAQRLFQYLLDRDGNVDLKPIPAPRTDYSSVENVFEAAVGFEKDNTRSIHELYELAKDKNDYATIAALQWFLDEQVEEEKVMTEALGLVRFAGDDKSALLALNAQFGATPAQTGGTEGA